MPRLVEILRRRFRIGDCEDRRRAIVSADASGHAACRVHGNGKIGAVCFAVLRHHSLQAELLRSLI